MGKVSILVIDDKPVVLGTTEQILRASGYTVSAAADADAASHMMRGVRFDLVILDCIPERELLIDQAQSAKPPIPVLVLTGDCQIGQLPGVQLVLHKPVPPPVLLATIASLLQSSKVE